MRRWPAVSEGGPGPRRIACLGQALLIGLLLALSGCASAPKPGAPVKPATTPGKPAPGASASLPSRPGGFYQDDGPGDSPPDPASVPDAVPRLEPLHPRANRPYTVFERSYQPMTRLEAFRERGIGSWYGRKFHGQRTSSGEVYDMYAMTAAHPTLPIPSYARVTHLGNGRSVVVRVNDRGPFLHGRVIDLSWVAAARLGYAQAGSAELEVALITDPGEAVLARAPTAATHYLQLGAFSQQENALAARDTALSSLAAPAVQLLIQSAGGLWRLLAGPFESREHALTVLEKLVQATSLRPILLNRLPP